jgi:hypothetical protein
LIEWKLVLVPMLPAAVVLRWAMQASGGSVERDVDAGNAVSGVSDAVGVGAGDTTNGVGSDAASFSFVPKTNSSIALPSGLRFLVLISTLP